MAVLPLKQPDDNDYLRYTGANYMKLTSDYYSNASWDEGKTFRWFSFEDLNGFDDSQSTAARWWEQKQAGDLDGDQSLPGSDYHNIITGKKEARTGDMLTPQEANDKYGLDGTLTFDRNITVAEAQIMHERKMTEMKFQFLHNQASGFFQKARGIGSLGISAMSDPANLALLFAPEPFVSKATLLARIAKHGQTMSRLISGAKSGGFYTGIAEIPVYLQKQNEKADYAFHHALLNVTLGTALGGGLHVVGGKTADWLTGVSPERHKHAIDLAHAQLKADKDVDVTALFATVKNLSKKKNIPDGKLASDLDAADFQREFNKVTDYTPPQIEYKPIRDEGMDTMGKQSLGEIKVEDLAGAPVHKEDFDITSGTLGSNEGNTVIHKTTGEKWYIKTPAKTEQSLYEIMSSNILRRILGDRAPLVKPVLDNGKFVGVASKWKEGKPLTMELLNEIKQKNPKAYDDFKESFLVHAWLGNKDWAAPKNQIVDAQGNINFIDMGGSGKYRAMGEIDSEWGPQFKELISFLSKKNPDIANALKDLTFANFEKALYKIYQINATELEGIIQATRPYGEKGANIEFELAKFTTNLLERRNTILQQYVKGKGEAFTTRFKELLDMNEVPSDFKQSLLDGNIIDPAKIAQRANNENPNPKWKQFYSFDEANAYINRQIAGYNKLLKPQEQAALASWVGSSTKFHEYNKKLRKANDLNAKAEDITDLKNFEKNYSHFVDEYNNLISALNKIKTNDNFTFFSGKMKTSFIGLENMKYGPQSPKELSMMKGRVIETEGFLNGSLMYRVAKDFSDDVLLELHVPKGSHLGFAAGHSKKITGLAGTEAEFILGPSTKLKINRAIVMPNGKYRIQATVLREGLEDILPEQDILAHATDYRNNKSSTLTAGENLSPKQVALNAREKIQKIESDVNQQDLNVLTREIADLDTELKAYNNDKLNNEMKAFREKNEQAFGKKKSMWDAMKGTLNCMIGKS